MKNYHYQYVLIIILLFSNGCAFTKKSIPRIDQKCAGLKSELDAILDDPEFYNATWGVSVQSVRTGEHLYLRNENKNLIPASNLKLFTTAAALSHLTPEFQYETTIFYSGDISVDGVLSGDIIIKGSGDPSISGRYYNDNITHVLELWADSLSKKGIHTISGNIIGDDNYFDDELMGDGWAWNYQSDWYAAQISALSFNDNCIDIITSPGDSIGAPIKISIEPDIQYAEISNSAITTKSNSRQGVYASRKRGTNQITIRGSLSIDSKAKRLWVSIENPTLFMASTFKQILALRNIEVRGEAKDIDNLPGYSYALDSEYKLATHLSPPLSKIVETINKVSQNLYSELLLRTLGAKFKSHGSAKNGIEVVKTFLSSIGINPLQFNMSDGSGLSRLNMITPKQITTLLRYMKNSPASDIFYTSLPIAGVDGSLKGRMQHSEARGKVAAKTGYLGNVVALSGYIDTDDDQLVFSIIVNNYTVPTSMAHSLQNLVCERLVHFSNK